MFKSVSNMAARIRISSASKTALLAGLFGLWAASSTVAAQAVLANTGSAIVPSLVGAPSAAHSAFPATIQASPSWQKLTIAQQTALKPMQADWANLDAARKKKWLEVAKRYQSMSPADQARMHERMGQWTKLTPAERSTARDNYSAVLSSPSSSGDAAGKGNLNEQWLKYQALSAEKKASLNQSAKSVDTGKNKPLTAP
jgi:Protein of unknown function (DUF3106)